MDDNVRFTQLEITYDEFHNDPNSIYIRCTYLPDARGFKVFLYNNIKVMDNPDIQDMFIICRGLTEIAVHSPSEVFQVGMTAHQKDMEDYKQDLGPEQLSLLDSEPEGNA